MKKARQLLRDLFKIGQCKNLNESLGFLIHAMGEIGTSEATIERLVNERRRSTDADPLSACSQELEAYQTLIRMLRDNKQRIHKLELRALTDEMTGLFLIDAADRAMYKSKALSRMNSQKQEIVVV